MKNNESLSDFFLGLNAKCLFIESVSFYLIFTVGKLIQLNFLDKKKNKKKNKKENRSLIENIFISTRKKIIQANVVQDIEFIAF